jgi:CIC family chloride channel protein
MLLVVPAIGGAIYGPLIYRFAREAKGHGVPEVMEAVAMRGGRIRPRVSIVKALASAICISTGGSVGREGPIAQIGSALGSTVGQWFNLSDERVRNLVACGAAGGVAATFNAPIAGSIFAIEVILGRLHTTYFGAVVISAVTADVVAHFFEGNQRAFPIPTYALNSPWELTLYLGLGLLAAVLAVAFSRLLYFSEDLWDKLRFPEYAKPVLGGLALGVIGLMSPKLLGFPRVFGVGYESIAEALAGSLSLQITVALLFLKLLATITTLGAGGSGGIFAPSLFMGAMLGQAFGQVANTLFPAITAPPGAYALVGMAAFFSGTAHAPVTAILILFEMTNDYQIIIPLMFTTVMATLVSRLISRESIYTLKLARRGIHLKEGQDTDIMDGITVADAMTENPVSVPLDMSLKEMAVEFEQTHHHGFSVVNGAGEFQGVVTLQDLNEIFETDHWEDKTVADIATLTNVVVATPQETLADALRKLGGRDVGLLPIIDHAERKRLIGQIRRNDIIRAYNVALTQRAANQHKLEVERLARMDGSAIMQLALPENAQVIGQPISKIKIPEDCLIISIRRGSKLIIAHGYTRLQAGDQITLISGHDVQAAVRQFLTRPAEENGPADPAEADENLRVE